MKIPARNHSRSHRQKGGFAVIVILALLGLVLGFLVANSQALSGLGSDLNMLEKKQIRRLNESATNSAVISPLEIKTNTPPVSTPPPATE
jgi:hypothetical protein